MTLENKVVVVTGATSGIGLAIAKEALTCGAKVMLHCSYGSVKTAQKLVKTLGKNTSYIAAELSDLEELSSIVDKTIQVFGKIDALVNNAGVFPRNNILNINKEGYQYIFDVNVRAPLFLNQAVIKTFIESNTKGSIVNVGSINAYCGQDDLLVYSMSKGALMTMTRNLADYLGPIQIRINQINVGWTHTPKENAIQIKAGNAENWYENINKTFAPRGSILATEEVARHAIFWISDDSIPVSGAVYEVEQYPIIGRNKINA